MGKLTVPHALPDAPRARYLPWSRTGVELTGVTDSATAVRLGGLDFDVGLRPAGFIDDGTWHRVPTRHAVVREDTGEFFDVVSTDYRLVQYRDAFAFMDAVDARYVAAGTLSGGRQGFIVIELDADGALDPAPNGESDPHDVYVIIRTSHDRSKAIEIAVMPLRGRCLNQLPLPSFTRDAPQRWSVRHVGDAEARLAEARLTLDRSLRYARVFHDTVRQLASVRVTAEDLRHIVRRVLPDRPRRDEQVHAIERLFRESPTVGFPETGWGLVNALGEHLEWGRHEGTRTAQSRFTAALQGDVLRYVGRATQLVLQRR